MFISFVFMRNELACFSTLENLQKVCKLYEDIVYKIVRNVFSY